MVVYCRWQARVDAPVYFWSFILPRRYAPGYHIAAPMVLLNVAFNTDIPIKSGIETLRISHISILQSHINFKTFIQPQFF